MVVGLVFKKDLRNDPGSCRPMTFNSAPGDFAETEAGKLPLQSTKNL